MNHQMAKRLCCGIECSMEAVRDINWHLSPAQLLEGLSIQSQEECTLVLKKKN